MKFVVSKCKNIRRLFALTIVLFFYVATYAQDPSIPILTWPSPNAAALARYADVPVSHYTGVPSINISLYEINAYGYTLPISLSYHASGIKVNQEASWVGLGWALNAGGVITRTVRGDPDGKERRLANIEAIYDDPEKISKAYIGGDDMEPDIFFFNFGGYSGKFVIGPNGKPVLLTPESNLKITPTTHPHITGWTIVDENGVCYKFNAMERTEDCSSAVLETSWYESNRDRISPNMEYAAVTEYISSWFLSEIILPNGEKIQFKYNLRLTNAASPITINYWLGFLMQGCSSEKYASAPNRGATYFLSQAMTKEEQCLDEIIWSGGKIKFTTSDRQDIFYYWREIPQKLDMIQVFDSKQAPVKTYQLIYDYFNASYVTPQLVFGKGNFYPRLKLQALKDISGASPLTHTFTYDESEVIPPKNSNAFDHWGNFNSNTSGYVLPTYRCPFSPQIEACDDSWVVNRKVEHDMLYRTYSYADRNADEQKMKLGTLTKIRYPTGGDVHFHYEANMFSNAPYDLGYNTGVGVGGGLRIAKIVTDATTRHFSYQTQMGSGSCSGKLLAPPSYATISTYHNLPENIGSNPPYYYESYLEISSQSVTSLSDFRMGATVGYGRVEEYVVDGTNKSSTVYSFMNEPEDRNYPDSRQVRITLPSTPKLSNGLPTYIEYMRNDTCIRTESFIYEKVPIAEVKAIKVHGNRDYLFFQTYGSYSTPVEWWRLKSKQVRNLFW